MSEHPDDSALRAQKARDAERLERLTRMAATVADDLITKELLRFLERRVVGGQYFDSDGRRLWPPESPPDSGGGS